MQPEISDSDFPASPQECQADIFWCDFIAGKHVLRGACAVLRDGIENLLSAHKLDPKVASSMAYVGNVMRKAIEVSALEHRMDKLETLLRVDNSDGHPEN